MRSQTFALVIGSCVAAAISGVAAASPFTLEDVLRSSSIDMATLSPDGSDVAVVIQRPVSASEVAGRTSYEIDPSRSDLWLVSRDGKRKQQLTHGLETAAGSWCAHWSPDGRRIAYLSTKPEGAEPRGGDSVRLYLWDRQTRTSSRLSSQAMMTQTRYGSPLNPLDLRLGTKGSARHCRIYEENAPFLWLDSRHILAVQMPKGQNSALFTQYGKPQWHLTEAGERLRRGQAATVDISTSPEAAEATESLRAEIVVIDVETGARRLVANVPAYPFEGMLTLSVAPNRTNLAILAPVRPIPPQALGADPFNVSDTWIEKTLGLAELDGRGATRWIKLPASTRFPLDLLDWSSDSQRLALRARADGRQRFARLFSVDVGSGRTEEVAPGLVIDPTDAGTYPHEPSAIWQSNRSFLIRAKQENDNGSLETWWRVQLGGKPQPAGKPAPDLPTPSLPPEGELLAQDRLGSIWQEQTPHGLLLKASGQSQKASKELLLLNTHLAVVDWGEVRAIDYAGRSGQALKALAILPPRYDPSRRYPTLVWVYPRTMIRGQNDFWASRYLPGFYNLQLYAALGYVVLVPSMPMKLGPHDGGPFNQVTEGVLPAVDKLVELGIADPVRIGVFGQSMGGYAVYALITQTDRFAAAAAMAGITDLTAMYGAFDAGGLGWNGIAQDKSANSSILPNVVGLHPRPFEDADLFVRNSPITYSDRVHTPLLLAHGSLDVRGSMMEAEMFFSALYRQGKPARLLRYMGESHSLALSPANVRDLFGELTIWFSKYVKREEQPDAMPSHIKE